MTQAETLEKIMTRTKSAIAARKKPMKKSPRNNPKVICISSGKGGVGKTNIAVNLAYWAAKMGKKVLILDADLNLANVDILLGITPKYNLHHVFLGEKGLRDILVAGPGGFKILPASSGILELADLTEEQRLYFLSEMESLGNVIDMLIIDTAAGINNNVVYFNLAAQDRIVVLTPEPTSLTDAYALIKVLSNRHNVKKFRVLINCAQNEKEALAVYKKLCIVTDKFLNSLSLDYLGFVPMDQKLPTAVRSQKLVSEMYPKAPSSMSMESITNNIANEKTTVDQDGNIKFFWKELFAL